VREGPAEDGGDAVRAQVAVPDPVQSGQARVDVEVRPAHQRELPWRRVRDRGEAASQDLLDVGGLGPGFQAGPLALIDRVDQIRQPGRDRRQVGQGEAQPLVPPGPRRRQVARGLVARARVE